MKTILAIVLAVVLGIAVFVGLQWRKVQQAASGPAKEIVSESMEMKGDTWHVSFVSRFEYPVAQVYEAFSTPERLKEFAPDNFLKSDLVSSGGNKKVVDFVARLDILPPGFKVQSPRVEFTYFPEEKRIVSHTIDFQLSDIDSEYKFEPTSDGKGTVLKLTQTNKAKVASIVEALQKGAIRESYITQVRAANRALGELAPAAGKAQAG